MAGFETIEVQTGAYGVVVRHPTSGVLHIFRYVYDSQAEAGKVMGNLSQNFGQPSGIETDFAANYWQLPWGTASLRHFDLVKRTTQKRGWYLCPKLDGETKRLVRERRTL